MWHPLNFFSQENKEVQIVFQIMSRNKRHVEKKSTVPNFCFLIYIHCCISIDIFPRFYCIFQQLCSASAKNLRGKFIRRKPIWTNSTFRPCFIRSSYSHSYCFKHPTMGNLPYKRQLTLVPKNTHLYTGVKVGFFKWYAQNSKSTQSGLPDCFHVGDFIKFLFF